jgi:hypothetical protein
MKVISETRGTVVSCHAEVRGMSGNHMFLWFCYEIVGLTLLPSVMNVVVQTVDCCSATKAVMGVFFLHGG